MTERTKSPATVSIPDATATVDATLVATPAAGPESKADGGAATLDAEAAKAAALAEVEEARVDALTRLAEAERKAGVAAYAKGERAARQGRLTAGGHFTLNVRLRLEAGLKDRSVATKACEAAILPYATEQVDVNQLIRAWWAHRLLTAADGVDVADPRAKDVADPARVKAAADLPWGHWKAAYTLLTHQADFGTATEHYTLLPGLEAECRAVFDATVEAGESTKGTTEQCQALVRTLANRQAEATRQAALAKQRAADDAQQAAADAEEGRKEADAKAKEADAAVKAAERAEKEAADEKAREAARQEAEVKRQEAAKARAAADHARFQAEQAARDKGRARTEANQASRLATEAEAKKASEDRKAEKAAAKGSGDKPAPRPPVDPSEPRINPEGLKDVAPDDVAAMLEAIVAGHSKPALVVEYLLGRLCSRKDVERLFPDGTIAADALLAFGDLTDAAAEAAKAKATKPAAKPAA